MSPTQKEMVPLPSAAPLVSQNLMAQAADSLVQLVTYTIERQYLEGLDLSRASVTTLGLPDWRTFSRFMQLTQVGYTEERDRSLGLQNVHNALAAVSGTGHSFVAAYCGTGTGVKMYMGVRALDVLDRPDSHEVGLQLHRALESNLRGTQFAMHEVEGVRTPLCPSQEILNDVLLPVSRFPYVAAVTGIPSLRSDGEAFNQSIDRVLNSLAEEKFLMLIIAEPVPLDDIYWALRQVQSIASDIHSYVRINLSASASLSTSTTVSTTKGRTDSTSVGTSDGTSSQRGESAGKYAKAQMGLGAVSLFAGGIAALVPGVGPAVGAGIGLVGNLLGSGLAAAGTVSSSETKTSSRSETMSSGTSSSNTRSVGETDTQQQTVGVERLNKAAEACEKLLDEAAQRLQIGKGTGLWRTGVYLLAENRSTLAQAGSQLRALLAGEQSRLEPMRMLDISALRGQGLEQSLCQFAIPGVAISPSPEGEIHHPLGTAFDGLATPIHTDELALTCNLPRREVRGLKLRPVADFGLNPTPTSTAAATVRIGTLANVPTDNPPAMSVPLSALAGHALVVGITGGGKTNTTKWLLQELHRNSVPFLVIEPAKREYNSLATLPRLYGDVQVFTLGDESGNPFRINPMAFVPGFSLLTHIDKLKSIFNAAFPMYAAMPYMLEEAILDVYTERGWDLTTGENELLSATGAGWWEYLPTLEDLYDRIDAVVEAKGYAAEPSANYAAALKARIGSLLAGAKGMMLNVRQGIPVEEFMTGSSVLQFTGVGDDAEKCFIMGLIFNLLGEYREVASRSNPPSGLAHVCIIEEAHRLLRQTGTADNPEVGSPRANAVESFANMLAEMRALGQGFILADQIPSKLIVDAIKNTNLKIVHRLVAADDVAQMALGMDLEDDQRRVVVKLSTGQAVVRGAGDDSAFLVQIPEAEPAGVSKGEEAIVRERPRVGPRWKLCAPLCDNPCDYYARLGTPKPAADAAADELLDRMMLGNPQDAPAHWGWFLNTIGQVSRGRSEVAAGLVNCQAVNSLRRAIRRTTMALGRDWADYDEVLRKAADVLAALLSNDPATESLLTLRETLLATCPSRPPLDPQACSQCSASCIYGAAMVRAWRNVAKTTAIRTDGRGTPILPSPEELNTALRNECPWLAEEHVLPASYCLSVWLRVGRLHTTA